MTDFPQFVSPLLLAIASGAIMHLYAREAGALGRVGDPLLLVDCEEPPLFVS